MSNNALSPLHQYNLHYNFQNDNIESQKVMYNDTVLNWHCLSLKQTQTKRHIYLHTHSGYYHGPYENINVTCTFALMFTHVSNCSL